MVICHQQISLDTFHFFYFADISISQIESILTELSKYHATGFHFLETYQPEGQKSFLRDFPSFDYKGSVIKLTDSQHQSNNFF